MYQYALWSPSSLLTYWYFAHIQPRCINPINPDVQLYIYNTQHIYARGPMTGLFPGLRHVTNMKRIRSDFSIISPLPPPFSLSPRARR